MRARSEGMKINWGMLATGFAGAVRKRLFAVVPPD